jgi:3'(2'), 5'-bisphosphate nucleotidase
MTFSREDFYSVRTKLIEGLLPIIQKVHAYYGKLDEADISRKVDRSKVTRADFLAHDEIITLIKKISPNHIIISEESKDLTLPEGANTYWMIDPIDGTRGFIKGSQSYAMCIALIQGDYPIAGVITCPVEKKIYVNSPNGVEVYHINQAFTKLTLKAEKTADNKKYEGLTLVQSNNLPDFNKRITGPNANRITQYMSQSSAAKFGAMIENKAQIYLRTLPTCAWDTAAGQALVESLGGSVIASDGERLRVEPGKEGSWLNPGFIALSSGLSINDFEVDFS